MIVGAEPPQSSADRVLGLRPQTSALVGGSSSLACAQRAGAPAAAVATRPSYTANSTRCGLLSQARPLRFPSSPAPRPGAHRRRQRPRAAWALALRGGGGVARGLGLDAEGGQSFGGSDAGTVSGVDADTIHQVRTSTDSRIPRKAPARGRPRCAWSRRRAAAGRRRRARSRTATGSAPLARSRVGTVRAVPGPASHFECWSCRGCGVALRLCRPSTASPRRTSRHDPLTAGAATRRQPVHESCVEPAVPLRAGLPGEAARDRGTPGD